MGELFTLPVLLGIVYSGIRLATPYLYAAIGEMFAQRSGVFNLGVEGIMLMGAYSGFFVAMTTGNLWLGLLAAALTGLLMGLMMAFISVTLQAEQGISGIGLHLFGLGLSSLLVQENDEQCAIHFRFSTDQDSRLGRSTVSRRNVFQSQLVGLRRLPHRADCVVGVELHNSWIEDSRRGTKTGSRRLARRRGCRHPLSHR